MSLFTIDPEKCNKDELCVKACPTNVIRMGSPDEMPEPNPDFEEYCLACGHCVAVCPTEAFSLNWLSPAKCLAVRKERSYFELFAPALGLGSCWGGYFYSAVNAYPPLFEALDLPVDHRAFGAVMVGYAKLKYQRLPLRNEPRVNWK